MNIHPDLRFPSGLVVATGRVFPGLSEMKGKPDWYWESHPYDDGAPAGSFFQTEQDALNDARRAIAEAEEDSTCESCGHIDCICAEVDLKIADALERGA